MSEAPATSHETADKGRRNGPRGRWAGLAFVGLLGAVFVVAQLMSYSGPEVRWVYNVDDALSQARESGKRVFLCIHTPGCEITAKHDRDLFTQRYARTRLATMIACRVEARPGDEVARRFNFTGEPLMLLLAPDGSELARIPGEVRELQFTTYIHD